MIASEAGRRNDSRSAPASATNDNREAKYTTPHPANGIPVCDHAFRSSVESQPVPNRALHTSEPAGDALSNEIVRKSIHELMQNPSTARKLKTRKVLLNLCFASTFTTGNSSFDSLNGIVLLATERAGKTSGGKDVPVNHFLKIGKTLSINLRDRIEGEHSKHVLVSWSGRRCRSTVTDLAEIVLALNPISSSIRRDDDSVIKSEFVWRQT
jgi:hypothetical protein